MRPAMSGSFARSILVPRRARVCRCSVTMRLASRAMRLSCAVAHVWQELSALSLDLGDHPGGYQYLLFWLRMLMCGGLCGEAAETDAGSRSVASRDACTMQKS